MDYLRYAECFYTLGKTLSFTKASQKLGIAQPAISRQIRLLEEIVQTQLFIRTKHSVEFTRDGKRYYHKIAPLLERIKGETETLTRDDQLSGSINIGSLAGIGEEFLLPITMEFKKKYPGVHLNIFYQKNEEIREALLKGEIDFAFFGDFIDLEIVRSYQLFKEKLYLVTNSKNDEKFDPEKAYFISYKESDPLLRDYLKKFHPEKSNSSESVLTVNSIQALVQILSKFNYYSVLAEHIVRPALKKKRLQLVEPKKYTESDIYFSYIDQEFSSKRNDSFKDFFLNQIRSNLLQKKT